MNKVAIVALVLMLSGCVSGRYFGRDYKDPNMSFVIIQAKTYLMSGVGVESPGEGKSYIRNVGLPQDTHCQVFAAAIPPGNYTLDYFYSNYVGGANSSMTYKFDANDPQTLNFESRPGEVLYVGAYELANNEDSKGFRFGETDQCGSEENALVFIQDKYTASDFGALSGTVWAERIDERLSTIR